MSQQNYEGTFIFGMITGAIGAAVATLLLTPRSGEELRRTVESKVTDTTGITSSRAQETLQSGRKHAEGLVAIAGDKAEELTGKLAAMDLPFGGKEAEPVAEPSTGPVAPAPKPQV